MESQSQGGSVRKNIALKLRDQGPPSLPPSGKREEDRGMCCNVQSDVALVSYCCVVDGHSISSGIDYSSLKWDHSVHLCGRPLKDPLLHLCEGCSLPVLIYGRMVSYHFFALTSYLVGVVTETLSSCVLS